MALPVVGACQAALLGLIDMGEDRRSLRSSSYYTLRDVPEPMTADESDSSSEL